MSAAASPSPSEGESKRGEVSYRFCQEWYASDLFPKTSLTCFPARTSSTRKKTAPPPPSSTFARLAMRLHNTTQHAPTVNNSAPMFKRQLEPPLMLHTIQRWVLLFLSCPLSVPFAGSR
ncbi:uncharacterized protein Z519_00336 [Cladophialophora bantiana CBS 173.52]|uniref:Uncharacterized protein n=1 Tax=Cladophialophora bantiana (strain ATCC 10958 / CBS 173.52 / CDC B-1940 / NIH 8579) TaxID=1442370 RepID=A0A0D2I5Y0_CLAB1|nr:uncharacterized protein Z519_00336 [Cladophialophora bantiana CBS 173.52]KIW98675.1 hypothetical protein Z519_00336 [Cladophialophora bantiana CBS 173.52]